MKKKGKIILDAGFTDKWNTAMTNLIKRLDGLNATEVDKRTFEFECDEEVADILDQMQDMDCFCVEWL